MQLHKQNFRGFLPLREKTWRPARSFETRLTPIFPSHLFPSLGRERDLRRTVKGTYGGRQLLTGSDDGPPPSPPSLLEILKAMAYTRGCLQHLERMCVVEQVRVLAGPFADQIGELIQQDDAGRVRVLLHLMGGPVPVLLSRVQVVSTFASMIENLMEPDCYSRSCFDNRA